VVSKRSARLEVSRGYLKGEVYGFRLEINEK
jgi:hypothetical protein